MITKKDLLFVLLLAMISEIWFIVPVFNNFPFYIIPYTLLILVLPGYALTAALKPKIYQEPILFRGLSSLILSILITIGTILSLDIFIPPYINLYVVLTFITICLTIVAFIRRMLTKSPVEVPSTESDEEYPDFNGENEIPDEEVAISARNVSMVFNLSTEKVDNIKEYVIKLLKRELFFHEFWALKNISFQVRKGEKLGIVGLNGAGKSTLLKLISGVMKPTTGSIEVHGQLVPLLEIGGGFNPNYTGRENIFLRGALLGYSKSFMESKYDEIVEFSGLEDFIDVPVKNYSTGMYSRLGFSISTIVEPQILILDEVLSVGDIKFRNKSQKRMNSFLNRDTTVILVSHSLNQIMDICSRAIWMEDGRIVMDGPADKVCLEYTKKSGQGALKKS